MSVIPTHAEGIPNELKFNFSPNVAIVIKINLLPIFMGLPQANPIIDRRIIFNSKRIGQGKAIITKGFFIIFPVINGLCITTGQNKWPKSNP